MTYINPGRQDNLYVGKVDGEWKYLPRQYSLWTLMDLLDITNGSELHSSNFVSAFSEKLSFSQSTALSRAINSLFVIKTYLIRHVFVIPAKISFCGLKVRIVINDSQFQLVFLKRLMISLKNIAAHLMTKIVCLMIVQNVHLEDYVNYLIPTLIQSLIWILILILIQAAWYLFTVGKHLTSMLPKYVSVSHLKMLPRGS